MDNIRLLLVDDHSVIRTGLRMLLESQRDLEIVGEAADGRQALQMCAKLKPDIVVMDITLPDLSGIEVTHAIKRLYPDIAIVALTIHEDEQYFFEMLQAGAAGYVPKRAAPEDLIYAIRAAHLGEIYLYPSLAKALVSDYLSRSEDGDETFALGDKLTRHEQEVLELLAGGLSNDEIADHLVISRHTVARHRENLMRKLGLHNRSELVNMQSAKA